MQKKINKNTYTKQKIYIKIQKYTEHKGKVKTKTPKTTQIQTATYIYDIKKYTQHIKYTKQKNIHQKSPTHTKNSTYHKKIHNTNYAKYSNICKHMQYT